MDSQSQLSLVYIYIYISALFGAHTQGCIRISYMDIAELMDYDGTLVEGRRWVNSRKKTTKVTL